MRESEREMTERDMTERERGERERHTEREREREREREKERETGSCDHPAHFRSLYFDPECSRMHRGPQ